ncbi:MAG: capsular polysaccharide biosynthesis protein [Planktomarina sp.]
MTKGSLHPQTPARPPAPRRVFAFNGGSFTDRRVNAILKAAGYGPQIGWPSGKDAVLAWGHRPTAKRAEYVAAKTGAKVIRVEDPFYRSVLTGRDGDAPMGLLIDHKGSHYDAAQPSDLEDILAGHPLDDPAQLRQAQICMAQISRWRLSKYNATPLNAPRPKRGYVLVIDQTRGDASIPLSGATALTFHQMLEAARIAHPDKRIVIKTHPETTAGHRQGHFTQADLQGDDKLWDHPTAPQDLFSGAVAVYAVSSQMGFEAILNGHRPHIFAQPFYAGWGLTQDAVPPYRRNRRLTPVQLFTGACLIYPKWFNPHSGRLCDFSTALRNLSAQTRAWRDDHKGWSAYGMRLWKRGHMRKVFGRYGKTTFDPKSPASDQPTMTWGNTNGPITSARVEDGFLRSRGLGANLVPPMSLVLDDIGIYFDATQPSRLEHLIARSPELAPDQITRAKALRDTLTAARLSKYNLDTDPLPDLPDGHKILVPGQVEDDASIKFGANDVRTNIGLLKAVRALHPRAIIVYKPHPDVEAGLRAGVVEDPTRIADVTLNSGDAIDAIEACDAVHTMTSLLGFEALLRGTPVTCHGHPFYAGWGLTTDTMPHPRRTAKPMLDQLLHATLIDYPRYFDPVTGLACSVEVIIERLLDGDVSHSGQALRLLSKLQGVFATYAHVWR